MKSAFIAGFVKTAVDLGYNDETIARVFKRAMANPQMGQMFNALPDTGTPDKPVAPSMPQQSGANPQVTATVKQLAQNPQQLVAFHQALIQHLGQVPPPQAMPQGVPPQQ